MKRSALSLLIISLVMALQAQTTSSQQQRDEKVQRFLDESRSRWRDLNVPYEDGKVLHDLIVKNNYTRAVEIGTSTGHSTVWPGRSAKPGENSSPSKSMKDGKSKPLRI